MALKRTPFKPKPGAKGLTRKSFVAQRVALKSVVGLPSGTVGLKRVRLKAVSDVRREENAPGGAWDVLRTLVLRRDIRGGRCAVADRWPEIPACHGIGADADAHHIRRTGAAGGLRLADPRDLVGSCRSHHDAIHANTRLAKARGLLRDTPFVAPEGPEAA